MTFEGFAQAKINLTLHVTGQRGDGYHLLDSLVVFADLGDHLRFTPGPVMSITVDGPFAAGVPVDASNLIWRAAGLAGWSGHIHLQKNLPHGAGIGSGSADAAAVLRVVGYAGREAAQLGADVPVCLATNAQRMRGIGGDLMPLADFPKTHAVLVNPGVPVPTPPVFQALRHKENPPMPVPLPRFADGEELAAWLGQTRNDLQAPAIVIAPQIADVLCAVNETAPLIARMSGSGATCFGLYPSAQKAEAAAVTLAGAHPAWWVRKCQLS